jgi:hypothetical protein
MADQKLIPSMDLKLKCWAEHYSNEALGGAGGGNVIARLMQSQGVLISSTSDNVSIPDEVYDMDKLIKKLPTNLNNVVKEHYLNADSLEEQRLLACSCSRRTYFRRLASAHAALVVMSPRKKPRKERIFVRHTIENKIATA